VLCRSCCCCYCTCKPVVLDADCVRKRTSMMKLGTLTSFTLLCTVCFMYSGCSDATYLAELEKALQQATQQFPNPDLVVRGCGNRAGAQSAQLHAACFITLLLEVESEGRCRFWSLSGGHEAWGDDGVTSLVCCSALTCRPGCHISRGLAP
jgi:hypothetical protein